MKNTKDKFQSVVMKYWEGPDPMGRGKGHYVLAEAVQDTGTGFVHNVNYGFRQQSRAARDALTLILNQEPEKASQFLWVSPKDRELKPSPKRKPREIVEIPNISVCAWETGNGSNHQVLVNDDKFSRISAVSEMRNGKCMQALSSVTLIQGMLLLFENDPSRVNDLEWVTVAAVNGKLLKC